MTYTPNPTWKPGVAGGTIISAVSLNRIEQGILSNSVDIDVLSLKSADNTSAINTISNQISALITRIGNVESAQSSGTPSTGIGVAIVGTAIVGTATVG